MEADLGALVRLELETRWITDPDGRIVRSTDPGVPHEPVLVVVSHRDGLVWARSAALADEVDPAIGPVLERDSPGLEVGWEPAAAALLRQLVEEVGRSGPLWHALRGPSWRIAGPLEVEVDADVEFRTSADTELAEVVDLVPMADRRIRAPWAMALVDGAVAAVCEASRSTDHGVEAGVWTYEPHRRRGLASAVTARWAALVGDRTAFYSTFADNRASQGVARRLGLEPLGQWWQLVRREGPDAPTSRMGSSGKRA